MLADFLSSLRQRAGLSAAEVQRRLVLRGVSLNGSTVSRWFVNRADACTPSPGQLELLLDVLGATDADRLEVLRVAAREIAQPVAA